MENIPKNVNTYIKLIYNPERKIQLTVRTETRAR